MRGTLLVAAGAFVREGRLLLARRPDGDARAGSWELPGGKVEPGETPEAALAREWREELGVDVVLSEPLAFACGAPDGRHVTLLVFRVRALRGEPAALGVAELRWATPAEAARLDLLPVDRPLVARLPRDGDGGFAAPPAPEAAP